jgi:hypothetical protein
MNHIRNNRKDRNTLQIQESPGKRHSGLSGNHPLLASHSGASRSETADISKGNRKKKKTYSPLVPSSWYHAAVLRHTGAPPCTAFKSQLTTVKSPSTATARPHGLQVQGGAQLSQITNSSYQEKLFKGLDK